MFVVATHCMAAQVSCNDQAQATGRHLPVSLSGAAAVRISQLHACRAARRTLEAVALIDDHAGPPKPPQHHSILVGHLHSSTSSASSETPWLLLAMPCY